MRFLKNKKLHPRFLHLEGLSFTSMLVGAILQDASAYIIEALAL